MYICMCREKHPRNLCVPLGVDRILQRRDVRVDSRLLNLETRSGLVARLRASASLVTTRAKSQAVSEEPPKEELEAYTDTEQVCMCACACM